jgi:hypothetical protein
MPYTKGNSGNPSGRKKGTKNRTTSEIQAAFLQLLDDNLKTLQDDLDSLTSKDRATILITLAKHLTPPALNPERLTEEQLAQIVDYLRGHEEKN